MKIYFAGSIRGGRQDKELYLAIINLLRNYGEVLTEHVGNQSLTMNGENHLTDTSIYERDLAWLHQADVVVAEVTTPSLGVGYEIAKAETMQKRVLCLYRAQGVSAMIAGSPNVTLKMYVGLSDIEKICNDFFK